MSIRIPATFFTCDLCGAEAVTSTDDLPAGRHLELPPGWHVRAGQLVCDEHDDDHGRAPAADVPLADFDAGQPGAVAIATTGDTAYCAILAAQGKNPQICQTCHHWTGGPFNLGECGAVRNREPTARIALGRVTPAGRSEPVNDPSVWAALMTPADFSCASWELARKDLSGHVTVYPDDPDSSELAPA